jgi:hypothetical protein
MKTIFAIAALIALGACQGGYSPDNPPPMGMSPFQTGPAPGAQPPPMQTYVMPSGRLVNCTTIGSYTNCH